jgi:transcriptional regulator with XRE-family HTH domain
MLSSSYGKSAMRHSPRGFVFTPEMGARLRELRERAGLSITEIAHVMGHRVEYRSYLKRLESGRLRYPTLAMVADYLRACRASFLDFLPQLSSYTNQAPVREPRIRERVLAELVPLGGREATRLDVYDLKVGDSQKPESRVRAARKQAKAAAERRLLDRLMKDEVNRLGVRPTSTVLLVAHDYARMVWKALELTRPRPKKKLGRPRKTREQRLAEARVRIRQLAPRVLPVKALKQIEGKVVVLFEDVHRWNRKDEVTR